MSPARKLLSSQDYAHQAWWGEYLAQYMFASRKIRGSSVLDLGCAYGYGTRYLFDAGASEVLGVDFDPGKIRMASENWSRDGVTFMCHDGHMDFGRKAAFDVVTSFRVLETSRNPDKLLEQVNGLLKPGGIAFLSTTNRTHRTRIQETPLFEHHVQEFDISEFHEILSTQFSQIEIFGQFCTRFGSKLLDRSSVVDFIKTRAENLIPWQIREKLSETFLGVPYFPEETEYVLRKQGAERAPILYAICRK